MKRSEIIQLLEDLKDLDFEGPFYLSMYNLNGGEQNIVAQLSDKGYGCVVKDYVFGTEISVTLKSDVENESIVD